MGDQGLMGIARISEHLGVKVNTIYTWVNQRKVTYVKVGRLIKFVTTQESESRIQESE